MNKYSIEVGLYTGEIFLVFIVPKMTTPFMELEVALTPDFTGTTGDWLTIHLEDGAAVSVKYEDIKYIKVGISE